MSTGPKRDRVDGDTLWDADGREWSTKHTRWVTRSQANSFAKRDGVAGLLDGPGQPVRWMDASETKAWWAHARNHFEVPGTIGAKPDDHGRTWTAHVWRRADARLIVFETNH